MRMVEVRVYAFVFEMQWVGVGRSGNEYPGAARRGPAGRWGRFPFQSEAKKQISLMKWIKE